MIDALPEALLRPLVWTDFRLAMLFLVGLPLVLLVWSIIEKSDAIYKLLTIYWKVASLLMVTVYLMIASLPISFLSAVMARVLIPVSLWFWVDLNDDIADLPRWRALRVVFNGWRWAVTIYCGLGVLFSGLYVPCGFKASLTSADKICQVWLEPPFGYKAMFHAGATPGFLGFLGIAGLVFYVSYLGYFVFVRFGKQGRMALR